MNPQYLKKSRPILFLILLLLGLGLPEEPLRAMPLIQRMTLPNKLVVLFSEEHSLPFVTCQLLIDAGSRKDPPGQEGLANLVANGLLLGTSQRKTTAIHEELDFMGASLHASSGKDFITVNFQVLKKDLDKALNLFIETLTQPAFPDEEVHREIEKTLAAIQAAEDQPGATAEKAFLKSLFPASPYGHPVEGTKESLPRITREAIVQFYQTYFRPNNSILAVIGDLTNGEVQAKILTRLAKWPMGPLPAESFKARWAEGPETIKIDRSISQANIILGHVGVSRQNRDYYALSVMNYILGGGGFSSRLVEEIRNKRGLAYSVDSFFDPGRYPGSFQIVLQTKNASAREAIALSLKEIERMRQEMITEKELEGATKYLLGSFPMRFDTQGKLANFLTQMEYHGLGPDYPEKYASLIRAVTREEVLRVGKAHLHPAKFILVIVGNLKEAKME